MFMQELIKEMHKKKIPTQFLKLDISKAFDMVNWPYLLLFTLALVGVGTIGFQLFCVHVQSSDELKLDCMLP
jgi:hypothetical protein